MPTYGYECLSCGVQTEVFQSIKDDPLTTCADCGGTLRKRVYPVGIAFKGSGFYVNDYASKPSESPSSASKSDASNSDAPKTEATPSAEPAKSEAKPEVKTESKPDVKSPASAT